MTCWLAHRGECEYRADGQPDQAHVGFSKRQLRAIWDRESVKTKIVGEEPDERILSIAREDFATDRRVLKPICRRHHDELDGPSDFKLRRADLPPSVIEFAEDYGLEDKLPAPTFTVIGSWTHSMPVYDLEQFDDETEAIAYHAAVIDAGGEGWVVADDGTGTRASLRKSALTGEILWK